MGAAAILLPLIPGLVQFVMNIVKSAREAEGTPEEVKAKLDAISLDLQAVVVKVQSVELPNPPA